MGRVRVLLVVLLSLVCVTAAQSDTLTLRRPDSSTYEMEGEVKDYKDGKFIVALTSGGETTFSIDQVQAISFEATKKALKQEKVKKVNLDIQSVHIKSLLESLRETFDFNIIYSPDAHDSFTLCLDPSLIKDRLTFYQEDASLEGILKIISAQTDFKCEMVQGSIGSIVRVTLKDCGAKDFLAVARRAKVREGTRANPAGKNRPVTTKFDSIFDQAEVTITLLDIKRGSVAWSMIKNANQFNDPPDARMEYVLARVRFKIIKTSDDKAYRIYGLEAVSGSGALYDDSSVTSLKPQLEDKELYAGATHEGWIAFQVKKTDPKPLMIFERDDDGEVWFELY